MSGVSRCVVSRCVVIVVICFFVVGRVAMSSFGEVSGGTDGGRVLVAGLIVVGSFVVVEIAGSCWHPGKA